MKINSKHLVRNPGVIALVAIGLFTFGSCKKRDASPTTVSSSTSKTTYKKNRYFEEKKEPSPYEKAISTDANPSAVLARNSQAHLIFSTDFLYWSFREDNLDYAAVANTATSPSSYAVQNSDSDFWSAGFRLGLGGNLPYNGWDIFLEWTRLHHTRSHYVSAAGRIVPILNSWSESVDRTFTNIAKADTARSSWSVKYDTLDLVMGRYYVISQKLRMRPYVGLEMARINQSLSAHYTGINNIAGTTQPYFYGSNNFLGLGPKAGLFSRFVICKDWGIFANASAALLWGHTSASGNPKSSSSNATTNLKNTVSRHSTRPTADLALGLDWSHGWSDKILLRFGASWEMQAWWGQNIMPTENTTNKAGDLSTQGFTLNARLEF